MPDRREGPGNDRLVVGLGNPGKKYLYTRHNVGFMVLDRLAHDLGLAFQPYGRLALICKGRAEASGFRFLKPLTYMNRSGSAVGEVADRYRIPLAGIFVVSDDFHLPLGRLRIRRKGTHGGHKGLKSIIRTFGTSEFPRLRIGVGPLDPELDPMDYVLQAFDREGLGMLQAVLGRASEALRLWLDTDDLDLSMNRFNADFGPDPEE